MDGDEGSLPPDININKTVEVARIIFYVDTPLTVERSGGRKVLTASETSKLPNNISPIDTTSMVAALTEALNGLVLDTAGTEFGVVQVQMQAGGSIEIIAIVIATYLAVKQGVEVIDTLQKVAELGRRLVHAVMRAQSLPFTSVHGRVEINPIMAATGRASSTAGDGSGSTSRRGLASAAPITISGLLLLAILNLVIAGAVLAVVLAR